MLELGQFRNRTGRAHHQSSTTSSCLPPGTRRLPMKWNVNLEFMLNSSQTYHIRVQRISHAITRLCNIALDDLEINVCVKRFLAEPPLQHSRYSIQLFDHKMRCISKEHHCEYITQQYPTYDSRVSNGSVSVWKGAHPLLSSSSNLAERFRAFLTSLMTASKYPKASSFAFFVLIYGTR